MEINLTLLIMVMTPLVIATIFGLIHVFGNETHSKRALVMLKRKTVLSQAIELIGQIVQAWRHQLPSQRQRDGRPEEAPADLGDASRKQDQ